jgi:YgiT-type zinc finger domain-containing protein
VQCVICRNGETQAGTTTLTLERDQLTLIIKGVPAEICTNCGEEYIDEQVTTRLLTLVKVAARSGVQVALRHYVAA